MIQASDKEEAPEGSPQSPRAVTTEVPVIDKSVHHPSPTRTEDLEHIGPIAARTLADLGERYRNELMGEEERCELRDRLLRARRSAGLASAGI